MSEGSISCPSVAHCAVLPPTGRLCSGTFLRTTDLCFSFPLATRRAPASSLVGPGDTFPSIIHRPGKVSEGRQGNTLTRLPPSDHCLADTTDLSLTQRFLKGANAFPSIPASGKNLRLSGRSVREGSPLWTRTKSSMGLLTWLKSPDRLPQPQASKAGKRLLSIRWQRTTGL